MKQLKAILGLILILVLVFVSYFAGHKNGVYHAVHDAFLFIVEIPKVDDSGFPVFLEVDDMVYELEAYIG